MHRFRKLKACSTAIVFIIEKNENRTQRVSYQFPQNKFAFVKKVNIYREYTKTAKSQDATFLQKSLDLRKKSKKCSH